MAERPRRDQPKATPLMVPPHDEAAERVVLAELLLKPEQFDQVAWLGADRFYLPHHKCIREAIGTLAEAGRAVDATSVTTWLRDHSKPAPPDSGGSYGPYLAQLYDYVPVADIEEHAQSVQRKWQLRRTIEVCRATAALASSPTDEPEALLEDAERQLAEIAETTQRVTLEPAYEIMGRQLADLAAMRERGMQILGTPTGFTDLDHLTGGLFPGDLYIVAARPGVGKGLAHETKVLTPNGWKQCGELRAGDRVIGSSGKPTKVEGAFELGKRAMYDVVLSDGGKVEVSGDHLWLTRTRNDRQRGPLGKIKSTDEIRATLTRNFGKRLNHTIPYARPIKFKPRGALPLDSYLLGLWLADGVRLQPIISNPEKYIEKRVRASLLSGDSLRVHKGGSYRCPSLSVVGGKMRAALKKLGLLGCHSYERFIPEGYLFASIAERIALLQGLCDADGHVCMPSRTCIEYSTTSERLAEGVAFLVGSLGGRVVSSEHQGVYRKNGERRECRRYSRMLLSFPCGDVEPVTSPKHRKRWRAAKGRLRERFIKEVRHTRVAECRCIKVAAKDGLFVTEDFIVTHNTTLASNIALNIARPEHGEPGEGVAFFSLEMPRKQIVTRMACSEQDADFAAIRRGRIDQTNWSKLTQAVTDLRDVALWIDDTPAISVGEVRARVRKLKRDIATDKAGVKAKGLRVVVVDYLQLMRGHRERGDSREQEVSSISQGLKNLAKHEEVALIAVAQLSRAVEKTGRKQKKPQLSDLRESGAIEQDSDSVWFIYRESYYDQKADKRETEIIVAKQRNGPTGTIELKFEGDSLRFRSASVGGADYDDYDEYDEPYGRDGP